jgi:hypothetical protein
MRKQDLRMMFYELRRSHKEFARALVLQAGARLFF